MAHAEEPSNARNSAIRVGGCFDETQNFVAPFHRQDESFIDGERLNEVSLLSLAFLINPPLASPHGRIRSRPAGDVRQTGERSRPQRGISASMHRHARVGNRRSGSRGEPLVLEYSVGVAVDPSQVGVPGVASPVLLAP